MVEPDFLVSHYVQYFPDLWCRFESDRYLRHSSSCFRESVHYTPVSLRKDGDTDKTIRHLSPRLLSVSKGSLEGVEGAEYDVRRLRFRWYTVTSGRSPGGPHRKHQTESRRCVGRCTSGGLRWGVTGAHFTGAVSLPDTFTLAFFTTPMDHLFKGKGPGVTTPTRHPPPDSEFQYSSYRPKSGRAESVSLFVPKQKSRV